MKQETTLKEQMMMKTQSWKIRIQLLMPKIILVELTMRTRKMKMMKQETTLKEQVAMKTKSWKMRIQLTPKKMLVELTMRKMTKQETTPYK